MTNVHLSIDKTVEKLRARGLSENSIVGVGVANQRETVVAWDADTGKPLYNAIVWCDNRTVAIANKWSENHGDMKQRVGLVASSYFSLFKILWLVENVPEVKAKLH
jgi:glycerol kinase